MSQAERRGWTRAARLLRGISSPSEVNLDARCEWVFYDLVTDRGDDESHWDCHAFRVGSVAYVNCARIAESLSYDGVEVRP